MPPSAKGTKLGDKYILGKNCLGSGAFGKVFEARNEETGARVAVKQVSLSVMGDLKSIETEIQLLAMLEHKNIVKYIDYIRTAAHFNIILELVEGGSLEAQIRKYGAFNEHLCAIYTRQILRGLEYLHDQEVIHRDIKGANVLCNKNGRLKLADFGVALKLSEVDRTKRGVAGTPYWLAPEIIEMEPPTFACDIWSVGSTVIEMLTSCPPYWDKNIHAAMYRIVQDDHPPLPDGIPEVLQDFLMQCFKKNPDDRASAGELLMEDPWLMMHVSSKPPDARVHHPMPILAMNSKMRRGEVSDDEDDHDEQEANAITTMLDIEANVHSMKIASHAETPPLYFSAQESAVVKELDFNSTGQATALLQVNTETPSEEAGQHEFRFMNLPPSMEPTSPQRLVSETGTRPAHQGRRRSSDDGEEDEGLEVMTSKRSFLSDRHRTESFVSNYSNSGEQSPRSPQREGAGTDAATVMGEGAAQVARQADKGMRNIHREIRQLLENIRPFQAPDVLVATCNRLMVLLQQNADVNTHKLVLQHGAVPIVEMLQVTEPRLLRTVLRFVNTIVENNPNYRTFFATVGLVPAVIKFTRPMYPRPLRFEAAGFVSRLCSTANQSLDMLVACGGLEAIVDLVSHDYKNNSDLVYLGLDALNKVFEEGTRSEHMSVTRDFCRILAKHGLCAHLCLLVDTLAMDTLSEPASKYLQVVVNLLLLFAKDGDANVKVHMAKGPVLEGLISSLEYLPLCLAVQVCKIFRYLTKEPSIMNMLENAGVVPVLCKCFSEHCQVILYGSNVELSEEDLAHTQDSCDHCLYALHGLCEYSRPRQEQAALTGVIPDLMNLVEQPSDSGSKERPKAFGLLCNMARASLTTRQALWHGDSGLGVKFFLHSMTKPDLQFGALEALVDWLAVREHKANWGDRVVCKLLDPEPLEPGKPETLSFLALLLALFHSTDQGVFMKVLEPLLKLLRVSAPINQALANTDEFLEELVNRLQKDADGWMASLVLLPDTPTPLHVQTIRQTGPGQQTHGVRRMYTEPAAAGRPRGQLLKLLLLLCQDKSKEWLCDICQRYQLNTLVEQVKAQEETRARQRVILCDMANQLLRILNHSVEEELLN